MKLFLIFLYQSTLSFLFPHIPSRREHFCFVFHTHYDDGGSGDGMFLFIEYSPNIKHHVLEPHIYNFLCSPCLVAFLLLLMCESQRTNRGRESVSSLLLCGILGLNPGYQA